MLKEICPNCKGNGFKRVPYSQAKEEVHTQCPTCNSQGEVDIEIDDTIFKFGDPSWIKNPEVTTAIHRGPLDLTRRVEDLEKQKKILQSACRRAGEKIADLMKEEKELKDTIKKLEKHFMKRSLI